MLIVLCRSFLWRITMSVGVFVVLICFELSTLSCGVHGVLEFWLVPDYNQVWCICHCFLYGEASRLLLRILLFITKVEWKQCGVGLRIK